MSRSGTFTATFREDALEIALSAPRRLPVVVFTLFWAAGWLLIVLGLALEIVRHPAVDLERNAFWLAVWLAAGPAVGSVLLWLATGQREIVRIDGAALSICRHAGPFRRRQRIDAFTIRSIGFREPRPRGLLDVAPIALFWRGALGRVLIDTTGRLHAIGETLSDEAAGEIVALIQARLAHIPLATPYRAPGPPRRAAGYVTAAVTTMLLGLVIWPAATVPIRLTLTDRAICFGDDRTPPQSPAPVATMRPDKRIVLVALDGIEAEHLEDIAKQFRDRYRIRAEIASARTIEAYDPRRRQLNAAQILEALHRTHPGTRTVVIAVTDRDMYIPGFSWRYAFSYRARERLAVVSTARMERGCLGLFAAPEHRRRARLRKMVAKNLGVLYYELPLSNDPYSLLYARIGGPQELDVMSEIF